MACDLDGTLLRSDGTVSDRAVAALRRAEAAGARVVLVTGRPPRYVAELARRTGGHETVVCANGGIVWDLASQSAVEVNGLPAADALDLVEVVRAAVPGTRFAVEHAGGAVREPGWPAADPDADAAADVRVGPLAELVTGPVAKLLVRGPDGAVLRDLARRVAAAIGDRLEVTWSVTDGRPLLECSAPGVGKGAVLAQLADRLGVGPGEAVAFGDGPNDVTMLAWAGLGVAMAGAAPELLAVADRVAGTNDDDGVAQVLEELFGR